MLGQGIDGEVYKVSETQAVKIGASTTISNEYNNIVRLPKFLSVYLYSNPEEHLFEEEILQNGKKIGKMTMPLLSGMSLCDYLENNFATIERV